MLLHSKSHTDNKLFSTMSDVCEALIVFSVYSVFSVDSRKKFSCSFVLFVVPNHNVASMRRIFGSFASMLRHSCTCTLARIRFCPSSRTL